MRSVSQARHWLMLAAMLGGAAAVSDDEVPDAEFLEYLGLWEESDEDWLLFDEPADDDKTEKDERSDPKPDGKVSTEKDNES